MSEDQNIRTITAPFWYEDIKHWLHSEGLGRKFKMILFLGMIGVGVYFMFSWFGWWFLLGFITLPAWYFWALRQIDRESYTLIEVRLEGDKLSETEFSRDTQVSMYSIPPDIWKSMKKEGTPFSPGKRVYICDHFKEEEKKILFPHDSRFTNLNFWSRVHIWMKLKDELPKLEKEIAIFRYNTEKIAMERALEIVKEIGYVSPSIEAKSKDVQIPVMKRMKKEVDYIEQ